MKAAFGRLGFVAWVAIMVADCSFAADGARAVPTFNCVGLYWTVEGGSAQNVCRVRYRSDGAGQWKEAMPLWFDAREKSPTGRAGRGENTSRRWEHGVQYRGSIVNLDAGTEYEVELSLEATGKRRLLNVSTWSEEFGIAERIDVASADRTLAITRGGSDKGFVLYTPADGAPRAIIDVKNKTLHCLEVRASHVIIRGLTLKGAQVHAIRIYEGCHDIVIEDCDIFGAGANFSVLGFPNRDSDIYGNRLSHCWDDAIESEGANCNVRIWGNYMTDCFVGIATAGTSVGPLYIWRNVSERMRVAPGNWTGGFLKSSDIMGGGRIFVFHNTVLQPVEETKDGSKSVGASIGMGWGGPLVNVVSRNNILSVRSQAFRDRNNDPSNDYDYDLYQGGLPTGRTHEKHGFAARPVYDKRNKEGEYALARDSVGYDTGARILNFNENFTGAAPDMGAHEAQTPPMKFGPKAQPRVIPDK